MFILLETMKGDEPIEAWSGQLGMDRYTIYCHKALASLSSEHLIYDLKSDTVQTQKH